MKKAKHPEPLYHEGQDVVEGKILKVVWGEDDKDWFGIHNHWHYYFADSATPHDEEFIHPITSIVGADFVKATIASLISKKAYKEGDMVLRWVQGSGFVPSEYNPTMKKRWIRGKGDKCFVCGELVPIISFESLGVAGWYVSVENHIDGVFTVNISDCRLYPPKPVKPASKVKTRVVAVKKNGITDSYSFNGEPDMRRIVKETFRAWGAQIAFVMTTGRPLTTISPTGNVRIKIGYAINKFSGKHKGLNI